MRLKVVTGGIPPGSRINEKMLCDEFGISRTPLREALKILHSEGLIDLPPNRGAHVPKLYAPRVLEQIEAISGIERHATEIAARKITPQELRRLRKLQDQIEAAFESKNAKKYLSSNDEIHRAIVQASGNAILADLHERLFVQVQRARTLGVSSPIRWAESVAEHVGILEALEERNAALAGELMRQHNMNSGKAIVACILELEKTQ
ncbi:MAG: GntR family transcriptional regulator [Nitratireductor sp.]|nr:GntR family transcriptional regulator [Nitratireductor sp.]